MNEPLLKWPSLEAISSSRFSPENAVRTIEEWVDEVTEKDYESDSLYSLVGLERKGAPKSFSLCRLYKSPQEVLMQGNASIVTMALGLKRQKYDLPEGVVTNWLYKDAPERNLYFDVGLDQVVEIDRLIIRLDVTQYWKVHAVFHPSQTYLAINPIQNLRCTNFDGYLGICNEGKLQRLDEIMSEIDKDPLVKRKSELKRRIKRAREKIEDPEDSEGIEYRYPKREEIALAASVHLASVLGINIAFPSPKVLDESWNKPSNPCWPHIRERVIEKYKRLGQKVVDSSTDIDVFNFSRDLSLQVFGSEE